MAAGSKKNKKQRKNKQNASTGGLDKGKERALFNDQEQEAYEDDDTLEYDENGYIPNGFTIAFDDFESEITGDKDDQAPRGGPGSQVLPVARHLPKDYTGDPTDGDEYLFLVRREAAGHPGVIVAEAFIRQQQQEAALLLASHASLEVEQPIAGPSHRPSADWRTAFLSRFTNMRATFANADVPSGSSAAAYSLPQAYLPVPAAADESSWRTYINGRKKTANRSQAGLSSFPDRGEVVLSNPPDIGNTGTAAMDISDDNALPARAIHDADGGSALPELSMRDAKPPIPVLIQSLDHTTTIWLLDHFNTWFLERTDSHETPAVASTIFLPPAMRKAKKAASSVKIAVPVPVPAPLPTPPATPVMDDSKLPLPFMTALDAQWIFSLLSVLDELLTSSEISILRSLARTCLEIADTTNAWIARHQGKATKEREEVWKECIASCWMVVAIIWEVWKQRDLWEG